MTRETLVPRRLTETFDFEHAGHRYAASIGRFPDGRLAELFLSSNKTGTGIEATARDGAVLVSLCLQHGCPVQTIMHALTRNGDGSPSGAIGVALALTEGAA